MALNGVKNGIAIYLTSNLHQNEISKNGIKINNNEIQHIL